MTETKILVTAEQAAEMPSIGKSTLWREVREGNLPKPIKLGSITRWRVAGLRRFIADLSGALKEPAGK